MAALPKPNRCAQTPAKFDDPRAPASKKQSARFGSPIEPLQQGVFMSEPRDYLEMSFRSIQCFANDGRLDVSELGALLDIAERDGDIDENEVRVLTKIIERIRPEEIDQPMRDKLAEVAKKIGA